MKDILSKVVKGFRVKVGIDAKPVKIDVEVGNGKGKRKGKK